MLENKTTAIFDLDGTLISSIDLWNEVDSILIKKISGIDENIDTIVKNRDKCLSVQNTGDIYMNYADFLRDYYSSNLSKEEVNDLRNKISHKYITETTCYREGALKFLTMLKEQGYKLVLATISSKWVLNLYNNENKNFKGCFYDMFDYVLTKDDVKQKKPNPEVYLKTLEKTGSTAEECLIFEDSLSGVQSAITAGIDVVCVYEKHSDKDREDIEDLVLDTFLDYEDAINKCFKNPIRKRDY